MAQRRSDSTERMRQEVERQRQQNSQAAQMAAAAAAGDSDEDMDIDETGEVGEIHLGKKKNMMPAWHYVRDFADVLDNSCFEK